MMMMMMMTMIMIMLGFIIRIYHDANCQAINKIDNFENGM